MKSFLFAFKIAIFFAVLLVAVLGTIFVLFAHLAADEVVEELGRLRAFEGVAVAHQVEGLLADGVGLTDVEMRHVVAREARHRRFSMELRPGPERPNRRVRGMAKRHAHWIEIGGRLCHTLGPGYFATAVPIYSPDGDTTPIAWLQVRGAGHLEAIHHGFRTGLFYIGLVALVLSAVLAGILTVPIRRMSRSMDRIAAGQLDHRVSERGRDEMATMGRSFNAMADRISAMLHGQQELMAGVSHELRSPLARMKMGLELLRQGRDGAARLDDLETEVDALDALVGELLLLSRFDLGAVPLDPEPLDLASVAKTVHARLADADGLALRCDLAPDATTVVADRGLLERLLENLLANAARYARPGTVTLSTRRVNGRVEVTVADDGPGVADEHRERLFEPFYRADPSRTRGTGGVGLGLMIVRRAVEAHDGRVEAREAPGGGLAVVFDLPSPLS